jgi:hypothetical protein
MGMIALVGCATTSAAGGDHATTALDLTGPWSTTVTWANGRESADGTVELVQNGDQLVGVFHLPNEGRMTGRLAGAVFTGTWSRPPYGGHIELTFDPTGMSFAGTYGTTAAEHESWRGHRAGSTASTASSTSP